MHSIEKSALFIEITVDESATVTGGTTQVVTSVAGTSSTTTVVTTTSNSSNSSTTTSSTPPTPRAPSLILPGLAVVSSGLIQV